MIRTRIYSLIFITAAFSVNAYSAGPIGTSNQFNASAAQKIIRNTATSAAQKALAAVARLTQSTDATCSKDSTVTTKIAAAKTAYETCFKDETSANTPWGQYNSASNISDGRQRLTKQQEVCGGTCSLDVLDKKQDEYCLKSSAYVAAVSAADAANKYCKASVDYDKFINCKCGGKGTYDSATDLCKVQEIKTVVADQMMFPPVSVDYSGIQTKSAGKCEDGTDEGASHGLLTECNWHNLKALANAKGFNYKNYNQQKHRVVTAAKIECPANATNTISPDKGPTVATCGIPLTGLSQNAQYVLSAGWIAKKAGSSCGKAVAKPEAPKM